MPNRYKTFLSKYRRKNDVHFVSPFIVLNPYLTHKPMNKQLIKTYKYPVLIKHAQRGSILLREIIYLSHPSHPSAAYKSR